MAGEKKGKAYEAFTKAALESLKSKGQILGNIFWDEKPKGMTVVPDFIIGDDLGRPTHNVLISHGGSVKESNRKYWRNCGELAESKLFLESVPRVVSIFFDSIVKEDIKKAGSLTFDGELFVGDLKYGPTLQQWIDESLSQLPKDKHEKVAFIQDKGRSDKALGLLLSSFEDDLKALLARKAPSDLDQIWNMERKRVSGKAPRARNTFVRRGISKLLIFEDLDVAIRLFTGKRVGVDEVPAYAFELGLVTRFTVGEKGIARPADEEISSAIGTIGESTIRQLVCGSSKITTKGFWEQVGKVRNTALLPVLVRYVEANYQTLTTVNGMKAALIAQHSAPNSGIVIPRSLASPKNVWLFDVIGALRKTATKKSQDFGYSAFSKHPHAKSSKVGSMWVGDWCGCFFNQYVSRKHTFTVPANALEHVATVLRDELAKLPHSAIATLGAKALEKYVGKEYEATLLAHRGIEPLLGCIQVSGTTGIKMAVRSCFGEKAELDGQATKTTVLRKANTLINWQSVSDAGRDHKKKELCGRAVALRYSWDSKSKKFIPRPGVEKLLLVVDGTWKQADLDALVRAGWDEIFYPDEMDKLAKAIV
jgi:hypothetical protein